MTGQENLQFVNTSKTELFTRLYSLNWMDMYRFAVYTIGHPEGAEDAVQEAIMNAFVKFDQLRNHDAFKAWIFTILANCCRDYLRKKRQRENYFTEQAMLQETTLHQSPNFSDAIDLMQALGKLSDEERLILNLSIYGGYKSNEIATMLEMSDGTIRSKQSRALIKLKKQMKEDD